MGWWVGHYAMQGESYVKGYVKPTWDSSAVCLSSGSSAEANRCSVSLSSRFTQQRSPSNPGGVGQCH